MAIQKFNSVDGFSVGSNVVVIDDSANVTANALAVTANANVQGNINVSGNVQSQYFIGDGSLLTGIAPTVQVYEFANVISTGGYYEAEWLGNFTAGAEGSVTTTIGTTAIYMGGFITQSGYPNITVLPIGVISVRIETQKVSGTKAYSVYAEIYSRTEAGSETLLLTTDVSTPNSTNFNVQQNLITYVTNNITFNTTDRIVVKFYGTTVSGTDNVALHFDDNTGSGLQLPALPASAEQFLPYIGATANTNLGTYSLTSNVVTGNVISSQSYTGNGSSLESLTGANVIGTVANATFSTSANLSAYANVVTDAAQPNITSVGSLTALTVTGGISGNTIGTTGNVNIGGNLFVTGNVSFTGNINQVSGNSGQFFGNASTGFGALYAGIPSGYTLLAQEIMQFSSLYDGYTQVSFQNISAGDQATSDFVATADNGDDETNFIDLGIAGSGYNGTIAGANNALGTSLFPGDGYLYTQGNTSANTGGNLVLGSNQPDKVVKIIAGGSNTADVSLVVASANTATTTTTTGTLTVAGGVGVTGNVVAGSIIATRVVPRVVTITTNVAPTPNGDTTDQYEVTALATAATFGAPTGTPYAGQKLTIRITDNGTGQTLAWNAIYRPIGVLLPPETVANKTIYAGCIYNATVTKWDVVAVSQES
jgi:hypothetical protein